MLSLAAIIHLWHSMKFLLELANCLYNKTLNNTNSAGHTVILLAISKFLVSSSRNSRTRTFWILSKCIAIFACILYDLHGYSSNRKLKGNTKTCYVPLSWITFIFIDIFIEKENSLPTTGIQQNFHFNLQNAFQSFKWFALVSVKAGEWVRTHVELWQKLHTQVLL